MTEASTSTTTGRPRRSTRAPAKYEDKSTAPAPPSTKPKPKPKDPAEQLHHLLTNPKSALTTVNMPDVVSASTWDLLSVEVREELCALLPPTAFRDYRPSVDPTHPSFRLNDGNQSQSQMGVDAPQSSRHPDLFNPSTFTDAHFLAAAQTFQDHLFTGWMTDSHRAVVGAFERGVREGTVHAEWKDDVWEREHRPEGLGGLVGAWSGVAEGSKKAGQAAEVKLTELAQNSVIMAGDVLSYRRKFSHVESPIEKDVLIHDINPKTYALTVLFSTGRTKPLPPGLLQSHPASSPSSFPAIQTLTVTSPTMLENALLDTDGRVEKTKRPAGNAWKSLAVWRWRERPGEEDWDHAFREVGGREREGTLFYLRGWYYSER